MNYSSENIILAAKILGKNPTYNLHHMVNLLGRRVCLFANMLLICDKLKQKTAISTNTHQNWAIT